VLPITILFIILLIGRKIDRFLGRDSGVLWHSYSFWHSWDKVKAVRKASKETLLHAIFSLIDSVVTVGWWEQSIAQAENEDKAKQVMSSNCPGPDPKSVLLCETKAGPAPEHACSLIPPSTD
jgi:hypothetical protein